MNDLVPGFDGVPDPTHDLEEGVNLFPVFGLLLVMNVLTLVVKLWAQQKAGVRLRQLCEGEHPVEVSLSPNKTVEALKQCIDRNHVHIRFADTKGGTELGFALNAEGTDISQADFNKGTGSVRLVGNLTLDYVKVRCIANIDLDTLGGRGHLEAVQSFRNDISF